MDDFNGKHAGSFGVANFGEEQAARLVDGEQSGFDVESFESGHRGGRGILPERLGEDKPLGWENAGKERKGAMGEEEGKFGVEDKTVRSSRNG